MPAYSLPRPPSPHDPVGTGKAAKLISRERDSINMMIAPFLLSSRTTAKAAQRARRHSATDTTHFDAKSEPQRLLSPCPVFAERAESVILALFTDMAGLGNGHQPRKSGWCRNIGPSCETTSKLPNPEWIGLGPILVPQPAGPNAITASS